MNRKTVVFAISIFLSILFLSTVGGYLTGFILLAREPTLANFPYPFIRANALNNVVIVMPNNYNYQEQSAAIILANSLKTNGLLPKVVTASNYQRGLNNLILLGTPSNNKLIAELNKDFSTKKGEGRIDLVSHGKTSSLIISGDLNKATKVLANRNYYPLKGTSIIISGTKSLILKYNNKV